MGAWFSSRRRKRKLTKAENNIHLNDESILSAQERAVLELKRQKDKLNRYTIKLDRIIAKETDVAKQLIAKGDKSTALLCLKHRKYQTSLLGKTRSEISNLEILVNSIEFTSQSSQVFKALEQGTRVLEQLNQETSVEKVEQLLSDSNAAIEYQHQVDQLLSQDNEIAQSIDESALAEEMKIMQKKIDLERVSTLQAPVAETERVKSPEHIEQSVTEATDHGVTTPNPQASDGISPLSESAHLNANEQKHLMNSVAKAGSLPKDTRAVVATSWKNEVVLV